MDASTVIFAVRAASHTVQPKLGALPARQNSTVTAVVPPRATLQVAAVWSKPFAAQHAGRTKRIVHPFINVNDVT
jgi:hypothetical protein